MGTGLACAKRDTVQIVFSEMEVVRTVVRIRTASEQNDNEA